MWIEWTISIRWVGLLICARVGLFWVGNINGTKFPDTARLQPIPPPMISTEKRRKKFQTRLRNGCMTAGRLVGWLGGEGAAFTKMHRSDKITSSTLLFLRSNRYWKAGTQNWDDWSGTPLLWRFLKLCKLWVFQGRKEILSEEKEIQNLGELSKFLIGPRYAMAFLLDVLRFCQGLEWFGFRSINVISVGDFPRFAIQRLKEPSFLPDPWSAPVRAWRQESALGTLSLPNWLK